MDPSDPFALAGLDTRATNAGAALRFHLLKTEFPLPTERKEYCDHTKVLSQAGIDAIMDDELPGQLVWSTT